MKTKPNQVAWAMACALVLFGALLSRTAPESTQITAGNHKISQHAEINWVP